jgi:hypothetical protein
LITFGKHPRLWSLASCDESRALPSSASTLAVQACCCFFFSSFFPRDLRLYHCGDDDGQRPDDRVTRSVVGSLAYCDGSIQGLLGGLFHHHFSLPIPLHFFAATCTRRLLLWTNGVMRVHILLRPFLSTLALSPSWGHVDFIQEQCSKARHSVSASAVRSFEEQHSARQAWSITPSSHGQ